jgi:hypothetical protein
MKETKKIIKKCTRILQNKHLLPIGNDPSHQFGPVVASPPHKHHPAPPEQKKSHHHPLDEDKWLTP